MAADAAALTRVNGSSAPSAVRSPTTVRGGRLIRPRRQVSLNGALIDQVDFGAAVQRIRGFLASGRGHQIVTVNLDFLAIAERDAHFRDTINRADLAVADGMPLVWASR